MKSSFNSATKDPLIRDLIRFAAIAVAVALTAIGIKMLLQRFKK